MINHLVAVFSAVLLHYWTLMRVKVVFALLCESGKSGMCVCVSVWYVSFSTLLPAGIFFVFFLSVFFGQICTNVYLKFVSLTLFVHLKCFCVGEYVKGFSFCLFFSIFFSVIFVFSRLASTSLISFQGCVFVSGCKSVLGLAGFKGLNVIQTGQNQSCCGDFLWLFSSSEWFAGHSAVLLVPVSICWECDVCMPEFVHVKDWRF